MDLFATMTRYLADPEAYGVFIDLTFDEKSWYYHLSLDTQLCSRTTCVDVFRCFFLRHTLPKFRKRGSLYEGLVMMLGVCVSY